jgi:hypothetical protein
MSSSNEITKESFLNDVKDHVMTVNVNLPNGYRHIVFSKPDTVVQRFEIVTTPSRLFYTGDMGSFTFGRPSSDMVYFFGNASDINTGYWAGKCLASDSTTNGIYEFDADIYIEQMFSYMEENDYSDECIEYFKDNSACMNCVEEFTDLLSQLNGNKHFDDKIDYEMFPKSTGYSLRFLWCLYALNWGCKKFIESQCVRGDL